MQRPIKGASLAEINGGAIIHILVLPLSFGFQDTAAVVAHRYRIMEVLTGCCSGRAIGGAGGIIRRETLTNIMNSNCRHFCSVTLSLCNTSAATSLTTSCPQLLAQDYRLHFLVALLLLDNKLSLESNMLFPGKIALRRATAGIMYQIDFTFFLAGSMRTFGALLRMRHRGGVLFHADVN